MRSTRVAVLAVLVLAGSCSSSGGDAEPSELEDAVLGASDASADAAPDVEVLGASMFFDAGTYAFDTLGVPVEFTVEGPWSTQPVGPGYAVITTRDSVGPGDHDVVFLRPTELFDPHSDRGFWPLDDLVGWLAAEPTGLEVSPAESTVVDGLSATTFDVRVADDASCRAGNFACAAFLVVSSDFGKLFDKGFRYRVIWIDAADGPLVLVNGTTDGDPGWLDGADAVVDSLMIG